MIRYVLNVAQKTPDKWKIWLSDEASAKSAGERHVFRTSPIFPCSPGSEVIPLSPEGCHVWLGFTPNAFHAIAKVKVGAPELLPRLYTSHGLAGVIMFFNDHRQVDHLEDVLRDLTLARETWHTKGGAIDKVACHPPAIPETETPDLYLADHGTEDRFILRDVENALAAVLPHFSILSSECRDIGLSISRLARQLSASILFLQGRIAVAEFQKRFAAIFPNDPALLAEATAELEDLKTEHERTTVALHQFRDEAIQVAAILQSVFQQALAGITPLLHSSFQAGTFSLFGIGGMFAALAALYSHVRGVFASTQPERIVAEAFPTSVAPPLLSNPMGYESWRAKLKQFSKTVSARQADSAVQAFHHLLYFSNRLGFRATKLSITAAYQSICLGMMPSWNLSTIFHEFLHSHVKAILAELLPLDSAGFENGYEVYRFRERYPDTIPSLTVFFRALILDTVSSLYVAQSHGKSKAEDGNLAVARDLDKEILYRELRRNYDQVDELFVHVLDLNYFYQSDSETYIRSIWCSWLTLPFVIKRIDEYALRTICTIASIDDGSRMDRFNRALKKLNTQLAGLENYDFVDKSLLHVVLKRLTETRTVNALRHRFFLLIGLADAVAEFLVFPSVQPLLFREVSDTLQEDESFGYGIKPGEYAMDEIESPVKFLMYNLKHTLENWSGSVDGVASDFFTLWSFQAIASTTRPVTRAR